LIPVQRTAKGNIATSLECLCDQRQFSLSAGKVDREVVDGRIVEWGLTGLRSAGEIGGRRPSALVYVGNAGDIVLITADIVE
jgi:hypothetical protein